MHYTGHHLSTRSVCDELNLLRQGNKVYNANRESFIVFRDLLSLILWAGVSAVRCEIVKAQE